MREEPKKRWIEPGVGESGDGEPAIPLERMIDEHLAFGIVAMDKPSGPTSHDVVAEVKRLLRVTKAGHGGTLDPNATGVLPVFLGRATRLSTLSLKGGKTYRAVARFHSDVSEDGIGELAKEFLGDIEQLPPVRSRVKRELRVRSIYELKVLSVEGRDVSLEVSCQAGTYIRKLIHDMGQSIGTGAHMARLRRTRAGFFGEEIAVKIEALSSAFSRASDGEEDDLRMMVAPAETLAVTLPRFVMDPGAARAVAGGAKLAVVGLLRFEIPVRRGDEIALLSENGDWIALGVAEREGERIASGEPGIVARPRRVLRPRP